MSQARVLKVPLKFGRQDQISQRHAPFGVLAECQNARVTKEGRLAVRHGYTPQAMTTSSGTLVAFDLFEHQGRLVAMGSDTGDAQPADVFEFTNSTQNWRGSDPSKNQVLCPFTNPREVAGISQIGDGVLQTSAAAGGGFVCMVWRALLSNDQFVLICRQSNGQLIHSEKLSMIGFSAQVCFAVDTFYVQLALTSGDVPILQFTPGTSTAFTTLVANAIGGTVATDIDLVPVTNGSTTRIVSAFNKAGTNTTTIKVFNSAGTQIGSTASVTHTALNLAVEADQVDNTINLFSVVSPTTAQIRTFNFTTGALTLGPTATTAGAAGSMCRLPTLGANVQAVAVAVNDANSNVVIQTFSQSAHGALSTFTVQRALLKTRLVNAQSGTQKRAVVFGGLVAPALPAITSPATGAPVATNALFYVSPTTALMSTRDLGKATDSAFVSTATIPNLQLDASTGRLCWLACRSSIVGLAGAAVGQPVVTLLDFLSKARRQVAQYAGLTYLTGATVQAYDGTFPAELLFNEVPGIVSATPVGGGALLPGTYTYVHHWEYTRADGSLEQSAVSAPFSVLSNNSAMNVMVTTPHSVRVALGASLFGGSLVSVLSRNVIENVTGNPPGSSFNRASVKQILPGMANYGATLTHADQIDDVTLSKQGVVYTQANRGALSGPLPHDAPRGCAFMAVDASRMVLGGLASPTLIQVSKGSFVGEPFEFSEFSTFFSQVARPVTAVATLDSAKVPFTTEEVYAQFGDGPDDLGGGGLSPPQEVPAASGLKDWRSILKYGDAAPQSAGAAASGGGVFFQAQNIQLYKLPRGARSPVLAAPEIEDLLKSFPTITAACKHKSDNVLVFACNATNLQSARLAVFDLQTSIWTTDLPALTASSGVESLVNFGDVVAYLSGGVCFIQSATAFTDNGAFVPLLIRTKPIYPFGIGEKGIISDIMVCGEYLNDAQMNMRVSLDDGLTFTTLTAFSVTAANGFSAGQRLRKQFTLPIATEAGSIIIEYTSSSSGLANSEQLALEEFEILYQGEPGFVNLDPADLGGA